MGTTLAVLIATCAPLVHPTTMRALIAVESAGNPYAVSLNRPTRWTSLGVELPRFDPPQSAAQAQGLVATLRAAGFTTSVGLAQINVDNLGTWNLPLQALLDPCTNLRLAQQVLLDCQRAFGKGTSGLPALLSCFNSGNTTTGIANGYVNHVRWAALRLNSFTSPRSTRP